MGAKGAKAPQAAQSSAIKQLRVQTSAWGQVVAIVCGEHRIAGNIIWARFFKAKENSMAPVNAKGGGFRAPVTYTYSVALIIAIGEGAQFVTEHLSIGRATVGEQVVSVGEGGRERLQPTAGFLPGLWKVKRIRAMGKDPNRGVFKGEEFYMWLTAAQAATAGWPYDVISTRPSNAGVFVPPADANIATFLPDGDADSHRGKTLADNELPATGGYPGTALVTNPKLHLGGNASVPNLNFPFRGLYQYVDHYGLAPGDVPIFEASPVDILFGLLTSEKHGAGWFQSFPVTFVEGALSDSATTIPVESAVGTAEFPSSGRLILEQEVVSYTGKTSSSFTGVIRGLLGTIARAHADECRVNRFTGTLPDWKTEITDSLNDSWSAYCRANDILISPNYDSQRPMSEILEELARVSNSAIVWSEGMLKLIPYGDEEVTSARTGVTFTPSTDPDLYTTGANIGIREHLTHDDFQPRENGPVEIVRQSVVPDHATAGLFNHIPVEFEHRDNGYTTEVVEAKDEASVATFGLLSHEPFSMPEITVPGLAADTAVRLLQRLGQVRNTYKFTLDWRYTLLEPMDVVTLTEPGVYLDHFPVRIISITEEKGGKLEIEAEEYPVSFAPYTPPDPPEDDDETVNLGIAGLGVVQLAPTDGLYPPYGPLNGTPGAVYFALDISANLPSQQPEQVSMPLLVDTVFANFAVRCFQQTEQVEGFTDYRFRFRLYVTENGEGVARPELEVIFSPDEIPWTGAPPFTQQTSVASKIDTRSLTVSANATVCGILECIDGAGQPFLVEDLQPGALNFVCTVEWGEA